MPSAIRIDPNLILALFDYNPDSGALTLKPTMPKAARKTDTRQWEIGHHRYSLHRLVWAWHHPENPNPKYITFKDSNTHNTKIENLHARDSHPRWEGHVKQRPAKLDTQGRVIFADPHDHRFDYQ